MSDGRRRHRVGVRRKLSGSAAVEVEMRYLVLAGNQFYPAGGSDVLRSVATLEEAKLFAQQAVIEGEDWAEVVDLVRPEAPEIVERYRGRPGIDARVAEKTSAI